ncbi:hypothetical protein M422DRAFT_262094 [Sphaerobolus stellatus SS14]|uniref:Heterokaryon incompatibility domain-containing protein n=1 Tax=Sphaerobolus stellatus (strain SS14) TaxID=990650 RepID=A0A0C9VDL0_SPHS4|nr:hypothetical protein M422DRAFT_262094 [Sphaerobolus stellatus SS14]
MLGVHTAEEKLLRIISSSWMQRLWSVQETLLARRLVFEFADDLMPLEDLIPTGKDLLDPLMAHLASEVFWLTKHGSDFGIGDIVKALRWRTTSRASDETLAISGLLNVDAMELVNLPAELRMPTFLMRVRNLPSNIIFTSSPKLTDMPGFRWVPRTLMYPSSVKDLHGTCGLESVL